MLESAYVETSKKRGFLSKDFTRIDSDTAVSEKMDCAIYSETTIYI